MEIRFEEAGEKARRACFYSNSQNRWQRSIFASMSLAVFCLVRVTSPLNTQTAHAGATVPVGGGFYFPDGAAVDRTGNVFVADLQLESHSHDRCAGRAAEI